MFIYDSCHIIYKHRQLIGGSKYFTTKALYLFFEVSLEERRAVLTQKEKESGRALHANEESSWKKHGQINRKHLSPDRTQQVLNQRSGINTSPSVFVIPAEK